MAFAGSNGDWDVFQKLVSGGNLPSHKQEYVTKWYPFSVAGKNWMRVCGVWDICLPSLTKAAGLVDEMVTPKIW